MKSAQGRFSSSYWKTTQLPKTRPFSFILLRFVFTSFRIQVNILCEHATDFGHANVQIHFKNHRAQHFYFLVSMLLLWLKVNKRKIRDKIFPSLDERMFPFILPFRYVFFFFFFFSSFSCICRTCRCCCRSKRISFAHLFR